ncbi:MAG: type II secretion system protein [Alphaproteobacteria bacterium]|nr:type II secretion system GspH family protein [Alphaproteobacteria bacterium]
MRFILSNVKRFLGDDAGFSLLELSVALAVMGIVAASGLSLMGARVSAVQQKVTRDHQTFLLKSLANYLLSQGKLPCPSQDLKGYAKKTCKNPSEAVGYVPFETLGLTSKIAQDGWGKVMRYGVHPQMTERLDAVNEDKTEAICKVEEGPLVIQKDGAIISPPPSNPFSVVLYSQGSAIGALSESERINDAQDLVFVEKDYITHKEHPHRHLLVHKTRNDLLGHYAGFSCPAYINQVNLLKRQKAPLEGEEMPVMSSGEPPPDFSWGD